MAWSPVRASEEGHEGADHSSHRHHTALFIGNTQNDSNEHGLSVGMDYEYRFNRWLGLGGLAEFAGGDFKHLLIAVPLFFHPHEQWRFVVAAGAEIYKEEDEEGRKKKRAWLSRSGVNFDMFEEFEKFINLLEV